MGEVNSVIAVSVALSAVIGILLGLLGGGGSTLTVPMLTFVAGLGARNAITTSLVVVGVTSAVGAVAHAKAGRVQWRPALLLGATGMVGAYFGGRLAAHIPVRFTMIAFAGIMITSAVALLRDRAEHAATAEDFNLPMGKAAVLGFVVGMVSGLTGAGGGFLLVAALTLVCGMAISVAVGTSLAVIAMHCFAALAGRLDGEHIDWRLAAMVTAAAVIGSLIGERLTTVIEASGLRTAFGVLALVMGIGIVGDELKVWQSVELAQAVAAFGVYTVWQRSRSHHLIDFFAAGSDHRLHLSHPMLRREIRGALERQLAPAGGRSKS
ncbi:putative membrane protein YfcA [Mycobacterium sp. MAA66]